MMEKIIVIRTHASSTVGIGHLARVSRLAEGLSQRGVQSLFVVDVESPLISNYLGSFKTIGLYPDGEAFQSEAEDAARFLAAVEAYPVSAIIVDDYRFAAQWEAAVSTVAPLCVLDDRDQVDHQCELLIDAKWSGEQTAERYVGKVPPHCQRLLGPDYLLIDERYAAPNRAEESREAVSEAETVTILVSLGGGGDMALLAHLLRLLLQQAADQPALLIRPVVGPFAINPEEIIQLGESEPRVQPITHADSLYDYLESADLYIGAAGGTLFEALALQIPSLTFSLSDNQNNRMSDLEDFGHYFHLHNLQEEDFEEFLELAWLMATRIERLRNLYHQPRRIDMDGKGVERAVAALIGVIEGEADKREEVEVLSPRPRTPIPGYRLFRIDDRHVNRYLDARNLVTNLQKMTVQDKVEPLDHYIWWLRDNHRDSYLLERDGEPLLYIWHLKFLENRIEVLIGGWFIYSVSCNALDVLYALNQELLITDKECPGVPWVAVIKNSNRFVQKLNARFDFVSIDASHPLAPITQTCFPQASWNEFGYYIRGEIAAEEE